MAIALIAFLGTLIIGLVGAGIYIIYDKLHQKEQEAIEHRHKK